MIKLFFNHLRLYVVFVKDFDEKRSKNETQPFISLCLEDSWLTKCNTSEYYRTEATWTRVTLPVLWRGQSSEVVKE